MKNKPKVIQEVFSMSGIRTKDGILYNPAQNGKKYISLYYHRGSGNKNVKNFWHNDITPDIEFSIFQLSDTTNSYCSQGHYWGIRNQGNQIWFLAESCG